MGWHKFLMKHGVGSPGYIAGKLAESYKLHKARTPAVEERALIRSIFVERIAAQTTVGGPAQYHLLRRNPDAIEDVVNQHPDLYSIVLLSIFIEHPELVGPGSRSDTFTVLNITIQEMLDRKAPGWRTSGIWAKQDVICSVCRAQIDHPNAGTMYAAIDELGNIEYACADCAIPIEMRAMSDLGFFMGERFRHATGQPY